MCAISRNRFEIPVSDEDLEKLPFVKFAEGSPELEYMRNIRMNLGGYLPQRNKKADEALLIPELSAFESFLQATEEGREISTTMAFVRFLGTLLRDKNLKDRIVPIVPDESRTFVMEGLFRQLGIWSQRGQQYTPQDHEQLMFYKESTTGRSARRRHQRSRCNERLDRRGDFVLDPQCDDDSVFHPLLHVWFPTR